MTDQRSLAVEPVLAGFHPDPSVCRVGDDYWLAVSSFEYAPGVPILHSRDLVAWTQIGNALDRTQQFPAGTRTASRGIFAPTLRHHDGLFWLVTTDVHDDGPHGHLIVTATNPAGPWADAIPVSLKGIDPDLAWDEQGYCYFTWCVSDDSPVRIEQAQNTGHADLTERGDGIWALLYLGARPPGATSTAARPS